MPPQDLDAEQATLGSMLVEAGATARAMSIVKEEDFYREAHRLIFKAMVDVHSRNEPVDIVTVSAELRRQGRLEAVGGGEYLTALILEVPTAAHVQRYSQIVAEKSILRQMISTGAEIQGLAYDNPEDVGAALDQARSPSSKSPSAGVSSPNDSPTSVRRSSRPSKASTASSMSRGSSPASPPGSTRWMR